MQLKPAVSTSVRAAVRRNSSQAQRALLGDSVGPNGKGYQEKRVRAAAFQIPGQFRYSFVCRQRLCQKTGQSLFQKEIKLKAVELRRAVFLVLGRRAQVGKNEGAEGLCRLPGQPGSLRDDLTGQSVLPLRQVHAYGKRIGLDRPAPSLQIRTVDGGYLSGCSRLASSHRSAARPGRAAK